MSDEETELQRVTFIIPGLDVQDMVRRHVEAMGFGTSEQNFNARLLADSIEVTGAFAKVKKLPPVR